jgi:hypothetical protein
MYTNKQQTNGIKKALLFFRPINSSGGSCHDQIRIAAKRFSSGWDATMQIPRLHLQTRELVKKCRFLNEFGVAYARRERCPLFPE